MNETKRAALVAAITAAAMTIALNFFNALPAKGAQNELVPPTSGRFSGVEFSQLLGNALRSLASCNKGPTAPANVGGDVIDGLCWIDDSGTPWIKKRYVGSGWAVEGALDPSDNSFVGVIGGGIASIASSSTVDLGSMPQANISIIGTANISSFGSAAPIGIVKILRFAGVLSLINSNALTVPGGFDLKTAAGDRALVTHLGSGNWEVTQFTRASGIPIDLSAVGRIEYAAFASVPALHVAGYGQALARTSYPVYLAKVTRAQNGTRTSGSATIGSVGDTSGLGAGMPVEGTGINAGCTIASVGSNSITLNSSSCVNSNGTSTITAFLYGYGTGGSSSTVGVPDCRGRVMAGRDRNDSGSLANRLTSGYFGGDSSVFNAVGSSGESVTMQIGNLIQHTHNNTLTDPGHTHALNPASAIPLSGAGGGEGYSTGGNSHTGLAINPNTTGITIANAAAGSASPTPLRTVQPTLIAECVVRVEP